MSPPPIREQDRARSSIERLGDFAAEPRLVIVACWGVLIGGISAVCAFGLLRLIGLITNVVFYQRVGTNLVAPGGGHHSPALILLAPVVGGLIVGVMARYGSERIRGHGMPEAIEAILTDGSKVAPRVALLKPISAAISIGTGGPFGAEGPIIMTGGAVGSVLAQILHMTADERKTLLVAGAAGGMAATFNAPLASVLLAVELLLFEWRPRSVVPVVTAVATSVIVRHPLLGSHALFLVHMGHPHIDAGIDVLAIAAGVIGGLLAIAATALVYLSEDGFRKLPIHWMWWPAIGGLIVGIGGLIEPRALGVGYDVIRELLRGQATMSLIVGILAVKTVIWSLSLGSGTSGGVLAPTFMIGAALGALEAHVFPGVAPGFWALMGLAAVVGGVMRSPFTGVIFPLELTHAWPTLLPLLIAASSAYALSTLFLKRSVLTEKVARRGLHLTREYSIDPLEVLLVDEVMDRTPAVLHADEPVHLLEGDGATAGHEMLPVLGEEGELLGIVRRSALARGAELSEDEVAAADAAQDSPVTLHPDHTLREAAQLFAEFGVTSAPVVAREDLTRLVGMIGVPELLAGRLRDLEEERRRERVLPLLARRRSRHQQPHDAHGAAPAAAGDDEGDNEDAGDVAKAGEVAPSAS